MTVTTQTLKHEPGSSATEGWLAVGGRRVRGEGYAAPVTDPHPHDHLFRAVFSSAENALGIFRAALPPALVAALDPGSLALEDGSYVDDELRGQESDLLFRGRLAGRDAKLYLLVEHQSRVEPLMPLRLLRYVVRIWERALRESETPLRALPAVVPIVLFHGPRPWTGPRRLSDLLDLPEALRTSVGPYVPAFDLLIDDLGAVEPSAVQAREAGLLGRLALVFLKAATDESDMLGVWSRVKPLVDQLVSLPSGRDGLMLLASYTMNVREMEPRVLVEHVRRVLGPKVGDEVMATTAEQLRAQGRVEGRAEGRAEGRIEGTRALLLRLVQKRFGALPPAVQTRVATASVADLEAWTDRVVDARTIDEVFGA